MQLLAVLVSALLSQAAQTPPIVQPGAPGQPSRAITARDAVALSRTTFIEADVRFMQHMIVHHAQAVEMVELLRAHGADAQVKLLGERIALSQAAEVERMRGWLAERGQTLEAPSSSHEHHGHSHSHGGEPHPEPDLDDLAAMRGMLTPRQMRALAEARGAAFDRLFLQGMIQHHQGALGMVDALLAVPGAAEDPSLSDFAASVVADQSAEILRMQNLLSALQP